MAAPLKFPNPEDRFQLAERYTAHCRLGFSDECFEIDPETLKSYRDKFPEELEEKIAAARRERQKQWESVGIDGIMGRIVNFNATGWIFNMKNRYNWTDRQDLTSQGKEIKTVVIEYKPLTAEEIKKYSTIPDGRTETQ